VIETHYRPHRDFAVASRMEGAEPRLVLTLGLEGRSGFRGRNGEEIGFRRGYATVTCFASSRGERLYEGGEVVRQVRLSVTKPWLAAQLGEEPVARLFDGKDVRVLRQRPASHPGLLASEQLLTGQPEGLESLFLRGQALSLLAAELAPLFAVDGRDAGRREQRDRQLALRARDILRREFTCPPSVEALARRVGTNTFNLKMLLHRHCQRTPYGIVLDARMEAAHALLASGHYRVSEVAARVGYTHASNFSAAFCEFHAHSATDSMNIRPPVPRGFGH
jgi:AraC-like DNA-binding protein